MVTVEMRQDKEEHTYMHIHTQRDKRDGDGNKLLAAVEFDEDAHERGMRARRG